MKINFLTLVPVAATAADDSFTLLAVSTQSATAVNLMNAVGHRNVTTMEALVQQLADESVDEPGWKFDDDIQDALKAIRDMFVKSIQKALYDQHGADQDHFNCFTQDCFGGCLTEYRGGMENCGAIEEKCIQDGEAHKTCRKKVYAKYEEMAQACGQLHCFDIADPSCKAEDCLCPDLSFCHRGTDGGCEARAGDCKGKFGGWLQSQITKYKQAYEEWQGYYDACKASYHSFLREDIDCDATQKSFEKCKCNKKECEETACDIEYDQCEAACWDKYENLVKEKECLERDRKIDWSATKKIECYIDVLLHDYSEEELLTKCGEKTCINKAREKDYKHCATICPQIDHEGYWPEVKKVDPVSLGGHAYRHHVDQFKLGDREYKCDANGQHVFTKHRGLREAEDRCTEHLDIDYQVPQCKSCDDPPEPVCDAVFLKKWYAEFDDTLRIASISDCCANNGDHCFDDVMLPSSADGDSVIKIKVSEHSKAWAYNRCECTECISGRPVYGGRTDGHQCGRGAHTISPGQTRDEYRKGHKIIPHLTNVCIEARGDKYASFHVDHDICVKSIKLTHLNGRVSCRRASSGDSNWGCDGNSLGLVLAEGKTVTAPVFDSTVGMTPHYSNHAHWYKMDGVSRDSKEMSWIFHEPVTFSRKEYNLWYNEDLTGGTEGDNSGRACYDIEMEPADTCNALAPLQFRNVCTSARGDQHGTITLPENTCVTEIAVHHIKGWVSCAGHGAQSNFGCSTDLIGLVWTKGGQRSVILPHGDQVEGIHRTGHGHAHWYKMDGVSKSTRTLSMKLKENVAPLKVSGDLDLWYNEDLTGGTEGDNAGTACYEVSVHRALSC